MAKGEFILELMANELGKTLDDLAESVRADLQAQVAQVAHGAFATITSMAQNGLHSTRQDYLKALNFEQLDEDSYLISLIGEEANKIERGYPAFDMKPGMLASKKIVEVGPRAGQPWVRTAKDGHKWAVVPFEHQPFSKAPRGADMASAIKQLTATNLKTGQKQAITKIFRDSTGAALDSGTRRQTHAVARVEPDDLKGLAPELASRLAGMVKYQRVRLSPNAKENVQSIYHTYRVVSENSSGWKHPGFKGLNAFQSTEQWVEQQLRNIIANYLG